MPKEGRKTVRARDHSDLLTKTFEAELKKLGESDIMYLGHVVKIEGGTRFKVEDVKGHTHNATLSGVLVIPGKGHQKGKIRTIVSVNSWVIVVGGRIGAVVGIAKAAELKRLYKERIHTPAAEEDLFERAVSVHESNNNNNNNNHGSKRKTRKAPPKHQK